MRLERCGFLVICAVVFKMAYSVGTVSMDPQWLYSDKGGSKVYMNFTLYDTSRLLSLNQFYPTTDAAGYDGTEYIKFDYQFSADSMKVYDRYDPNTVIYADYRPGYAGFKIDWDNGITTFNLAKYKYLVFSHMGPSAGHKVIIRFGYNSGCGSPTTFDEIGSFESSSSWTRTKIRIPDVIRKTTPEEQTNRTYYEMQVIINNVDPNGSPSSAPGVLMLDDISLEDTSGTFDDEEASGCGCGAGTGVALLPPMLIKAVAWRRRRRRDELGLEEKA